MKLLIHINQIDSIRKGENAPNSTEIFDLDPGNLPAEHRGFVADHLNLVTGELRWSANGFIENLTITVPVTKEAVLAAIAAAYDAFEAAVAQERAEADTVIRTALEAAKTKPKTLKVGYHVGCEKSIHVGDYGNPSLMVPVEYYQIATVYASKASPERVAQYTAACERMRREREAAEAQAIESATPAILEMLAAKEARIARRKEQLDAAAAEISPVFARKWAAGRAKEDVIIDHLRQRILAERSLVEAKSWEYSETVYRNDSFTDREFAAYERFQAAVPEFEDDANGMSLARVWDSEKETDEDGQTTEREFNHRLVARNVSLKAGEIEVRADIVIYSEE